MLDLAKLFTLKLLDTVISSLKNIFMIKNMPFLSALSNSVSYLFYILLLKQLLSATTLPAIIATLLSVFIGQYATQVIADKFDKEKVWKISITPTSIEEGQSIADELREVNLALQTFPCYTFEMDKALAVNVFAQTKSESALIDEILKKYPKVKFNIVEIKNRF